MAAELLEVVEKLQSRLSENQEPRKLLKTLKRLDGLPITVDVLVETGVGRSVNSLRKHNVVGEVARNLVAKWKTLVPQPVDRPSSGKEVRNQPRGADARNAGRKRPRDPSPEEPRFVEPEEEEEEEEEEVEEQEQDEEEADRGYRPGYSPSPPQHHYSPLQGGYRSEGYESPPEDEPAPVPSPPRKEVKETKSHKDPVKERASHVARESDRRRHQADGPRRVDGGSGSGSDGKKRSTDSGATHKSTKHSSHSAAHGGKEGKKEKDKKGTSEGRSQERRSKPEMAQRGDEEEEEPFEAPTMSFESFLTYDAPTSSRKKKKKQPPRPAQLSRPNPTPPTAASMPTKPSKVNGTHNKQPEPPAAPSPVPPIAEKRRKVIDVVPTLPDIPLPAIQPNYRPLPSIDITPLSPQRRKVPVSCDEEDAGFSGRRLNTKTGVYSGSKTAYLPKMMSLYEQCIRVLQNNIDSIEEVGGVPFEILEPVLERCTPEQLFRIEQCNQWFTEETDELWMRHCRRDFKNESLQQYETWREMYLRLHDEREERLRMLTQNISSAHAQRPKGRQVKMAYVNSVVKPPRDVRRRQEKFGTAGGSSGSGAGSSSTHSPVRIRPAASYSSQSGDSAQPSQSSTPLPARLSAGGQASAGGGHGARDKPQVKKIAPMMAKTIKAFKNRFSRR